VHFGVIAVESLPFPFHLFRCPFEGDHLRALAASGARSGERATPLQLARAFEVFRSDKGVELATCPYHTPNWSLAAERAASAVNPDGSHREPATHGFDEDTAWAAWSMFFEPIYLDGERLGNGQHRTCALKCANAVAVPVEAARRRNV
jgi:hypothetical protein